MVSHYFSVVTQTARAKISQLVARLWTSCQQLVFCLSQVVNKFGTTFWQLVKNLTGTSDLLKGCPITTLIQICSNNSHKVDNAYIYHNSEQTCHQLRFLPVYFFIISSTIWTQHYFSYLISCCMLPLMAVRKIIKRWDHGIALVIVNFWTLKKHWIFLFPWRLMMKSWLFLNMCKKEILSIT